MAPGCPRRAPRREGTRASPLNVASMMWWTLRPRRNVTCSVMPADVANDETACSASCGSNAGLPSGRHSGSSTSHTTNGRPDRSSATSTSASSSGYRPLANRRTPALSPSASRNASPRRWRRLRPCGGCRCGGRPSACDAQVEAAVLAELIEHVVVERDAGRDLGAPEPSRSIDEIDRRLLRRPLDRARAAHCSDLRACAARNSSFSSGVPTVTRRQSVERGPPRAVADQACCGRAAPATPRRPGLSAAGGTGRSWHRSGTRRPSSCRSAARSARARRRSAATRAPSRR